MIQTKDDLSGADIKAMCTEAGLLALRERRMKVTKDDFDKAKEKVLYLKKGDIPEGLYIWSKFVKANIYFIKHKESSENESYSLSKCLFLTLAQFLLELLENLKKLC